MTEIWKRVEGYEGYYEVSNEGRVRSIYRIIERKNGIPQTIKDKLLSMHENDHGYYCLNLSREGSGTIKKIHRLVAETFIPNPGKLPEVNHIDEVKTNNFLDNLEWCTSQHNVEHSQAKHYILISPEGEKVEIFNLSKFCRENKLSNANICGVITGKRKQSAGWRKYYDE